MPEKNGYEGGQEEYWHPDGSGKRVTREVFEREMAARQATKEQRMDFGLVPHGSVVPDGGLLGLGREDMVQGRFLPIDRGPTIPMPIPPRPQRERWVSLPLVGFGQRQSALHGQLEIFPQPYEADIEVSQIVGIAQVAEPEYQRHGALSDVFLRFGGKVFCTLTRQQLRQRLGFSVEEVTS